MLFFLFTKLDQMSRGRPKNHFLNDFFLFGIYLKSNYLAKVLIAFSFLSNFFWVLMNEVWFVVGTPKNTKQIENEIF